MLLLFIYIYPLVEQFLCSLVFLVSFPFLLESFSFFLKSSFTLSFIFLLFLSRCAIVSKHFHFCLPGNIFISLSFVFFYRSLQIYYPSLGYSPPGHWIVIHSTVLSLYSYWEFSCLSNCCHYVIILKIDFWLTSRSFPCL